MAPYSVDLKLRRRTRLKNKETKAILDVLEAATGVPVFQEAKAIETAEFGDLNVVIVDGAVLGIEDESGAFLSVRGCLQSPPTKRFVTVDMGAVRFVINGADVMAPGIVDADPAIQEGDWVWIRDEKNQRCLGVGKALQSGRVMATERKGKSVKAVLYVGDKLWALEQA